MQGVANESASFKKTLWTPESGGAMNPQQKSPKYRKILLATDGSSSARLASEHALWLAEQTGAELVAVYVVDTHQAFRAGIHSAEASAEMAAAGCLALSQVAEKAASLGVNVRTEMLEGDPKTVIVDYAAQEEADCLVVGSHGSGALQQVLLGSVSEYCVHHATCPVLVVRASSGR